jgi:hypothetical protein
MIGVAVSRELGRYGAVYVEPMWVNNSNLLPSELVDHNDTIMVGVGARIRVRPTVYVVGEYIRAAATRRGSTTARSASRRWPAGTRSSSISRTVRHDDGAAGARRHGQ